MQHYPAILVDTGLLVAFYDAADFSDLALIAISERLGIAAIATLDKDFDIYRRYRKDPFDRVFRP